MKRLLLFGFLVLSFASISAFSLVYLFQKHQLACANSISCINSLTTMVENDSEGIFMGRKVSVPNIDLSKDTLPVVLGDQDPKPVKHIFVDLETQTLYAYEDNALFLEALVSTGRWGRTPPGEYRIWVKMRATRMAGGSGSDAYNLPNVPYVLFFFNNKVPKDRGYSIHGAYWHNNFGYEMSHGCVNMREIDAEKIYNWASPTTIKTTTYESAQDPGTPVTICKKMYREEGSLPTCIEE